MDVLYLPGVDRHSRWDQLVADKCRDHQCDAAVACDNVVTRSSRRTTVRKTSMYPLSGSEAVQMGVDQVGYRGRRPGRRSPTRLPRAAIRSPTRRGDPSGRRQPACPRAAVCAWPPSVRERECRYPSSSFVPRSPGCICHGLLAQDPLLRCRLAEGLSGPVSRKPVTAQVDHERGKLTAEAPGPTDGSSSDSSTMPTSSGSLRDP